MGSLHVWDTVGGRDPRKTENAQHTGVTSEIHRTKYHLGTRDRPKTVAGLIEAADHIAEKLRMLADTYAPPNRPDDEREACGFLRSAGASWFVRFAHNGLYA